MVSHAAQKTMKDILCLLAEAYEPWAQKKLNFKVTVRAQKFHNDMADKMDCNYKPAETLTGY